MALAEINLRAIYALRQSDWLAQDLELEPRKPGRSAQTYFSFPSPPTFARACAYPEKIRLARETTKRAKPGRGKPVLIMRIGFLACLHAIYLERNRFSKIATLFFMPL